MSFFGGIIHGNSLQRCVVCRPFGHWPVAAIDDAVVAERIPHNINVRSIEVEIDRRQLPGRRRSFNQRRYLAEYIAALSGRIRIQLLKLLEAELILLPLLLLYPEISTLR